MPRVEFAKLNGPPDQYYEKNIGIIQDLITLVLNELKEHQKQRFDVVVEYAGINIDALTHEYVQGKILILEKLLTVVNTPYHPGAKTMEIVEKLISVGQKQLSEVIIEKKKRKWFSWIPRPIRFGVVLSVLVAVVAITLPYILKFCLLYVFPIFTKFFSMTIPYVFHLFITIISYPFS